MDTQNSSVVDVPDLKLAKVGAKRDKKRGAAGWLGARGAGSAFSGAAGGAGAGGGILGTGMSLAKLLTVLLVSGGLSAGAWQVGNMMANSSTSAPAAPKVFADKDGPQKYADTSGVIKGGDRSIPNSLGYVNNDGLTDEQRAAKKAADAAAAAKAAADAQAKADADAKEKAVADAKAASATPDPTAAGESPASPKLGLGGSRFGGMKSSFGGGGGGLSGGAGLSGGIGQGFAGASGLGGKPLGGALAAFRTPTKVASSRAAGPTHGKSNSKGFAKQQLDMANGMSRTAAATGKSETASAGAAAPFDNNAPQGTVISGPGLGSGTQTGPADSGPANNPSNGYGGPIGGGGAACANANFEPDINGNCVTQTSNPTGQNAAPYQGLLDAAMIMLGIVMIMSMFAMYFWKASMAAGAAPIAAGTLLTMSHACAIVAALMGAAICGIGVAIATMKHGDFMIGGILGVVGAFISTAAIATYGGATSTTSMLLQPAGVLIGSAVGELAAMSGKAKQAAMQ